MAAALESIPLSVLPTPCLGDLENTHSGTIVVGEVQIGLCSAAMRFPFL